MSAVPQEEVKRRFPNSLSPQAKKRKKREEHRVAVTGRSRVTG